MYIMYMCLLGMIICSFWYSSGGLVLMNVDCSLITLVKLPAADTRRQFMLFITVYIGVLSLCNYLYIAYI